VATAAWPTFAAPPVLRKLAACLALADSCAARGVAPADGAPSMPRRISRRAWGLGGAERRACARAQLGKDLAAQRKQLRLFRHPLRTLYYFGACAGGAAASGALWLARHRLTLYLLVPALLAYAGLKATGARGARRAALLSGAACTAAVLRALMQGHCLPARFRLPLLS